MKLFLSYWVLFPYWGEWNWVVKQVCARWYVSGEGAELHECEEHSSSYAVERVPLEGQA